MLTEFYLKVICIYLLFVSLAVSTFFYTESFVVQINIRRQTGHQTAFTKSNAGLILCTATMTALCSTINQMSDMLE